MRKVLNMREPFLSLQSQIKELLELPALRKKVLLDEQLLQSRAEMVRTKEAD